MPSGSAASYFLITVLILLPIIILYLLFTYPQVFSFLEGTQINGFLDISVTSASVNSTMISLTLKNGLAFPVSIQNITAYSNGTLYSKFKCYGQLQIVSGNELFQCYVNGTFNPNNFFAKINITYELNNQASKIGVSSGTISINNPLIKI